jgi:hypothetical protein
MSALPPKADIAERQSGISVGYKSKIEPPDQSRPLCLDLGQFMGCFVRGAAVRSSGDNAAEYCRDSKRHNRRIELDCASHNGDENYASGRDGDLAGQNELAAALDPGGEIVYFRLKPLDLGLMITFIHDRHAGER